MGRTGPAPPEGVSPPTFLHIHATSAVVDISPPAKANGIITIYRVFEQKRDLHLLVYFAFITQNHNHTCIFTALFNIFQY